MANAGAQVDKNARFKRLGSDNADDVKYWQTQHYTCSHVAESCYFVSKCQSWGVLGVSFIMCGWGFVSLRKKSVAGVARLVSVHPITFNWTHPAGVKEILASNAALASFFLTSVGFTLSDLATPNRSYFTQYRRYFELAKLAKGQYENTDYPAISKMEFAENRAMVDEKLRLKIHPFAHHWGRHVVLRKYFARDSPDRYSSLSSFLWDYVFRYEALMAFLRSEVVACEAIALCHRSTLYPKEVTSVDARITIEKFLDQELKHAQASFKKYCSAARFDN